MELLLETTGICLVSLGGLLIGRRASMTSHAMRLGAMGFSFVILMLILAARQSGLWPSFPVLSILAAGRIRFVVLAFAVALGLTAPLGELRNPVLRAATCLVLGVFLAALISLPFLGPVILQYEMPVTQNYIDQDGVCRQSQPFTCGPAAAVTALNYFGLEATEGQLARDARTAPIIGTSPWDLYRVLKKNYASQGLSCSFGHLNSLENLPPEGILLAVVRDTAATDHCVVVMQADERKVVLADPVDGLISVNRAYFNSIWRNCGIVLQKQTLAVSSL